MQTGINKSHNHGHTVHKHSPVVPTAAYHYYGYAHFLRKRLNIYYVIITSGYFIQILYSPGPLRLLHLFHMQHMQMQRPTDIIVRTVPTTPPIRALSFCDDAVFGVLCVLI